MIKWDFTHPDYPFMSGETFSLVEILMPAFERFTDECMMIVTDEWPIDTGDSLDAWDFRIDTVGNNSISAVIFNPVTDKKGRPYAGYIRRRAFSILKGTGILGELVGEEKARIIENEALPVLLDDCAEAITNYYGWYGIWQLVPMLR